jgi:HAD superfamily hydrolase (TIGR01509 family)
MIEAVIFDFDGLIVDTELPVFQAWQEIYEEHNAVLPLEEWGACIGGAAEFFDVYGYLETQIGRSVLRADIAVKQRKRHLDLVAVQAILPGVEDYIATAKRLGLKLAVASSSPRSWVAGHLSRLGLFDHFDYTHCGDEVSNKKPDPELYLSVLTALGLRGDQAIALEDSPNGLWAAHRAGIFCVAVPNIITGQLPLDHANMQLTSLANMPLEALITEVEKRQPKELFLERQHHL